MLQVSLYRLRKLLGRDDVIFMQDGKVRLKQEVCWVDAWAFADKLTRLKTLPVAGAEFSRLSIEALHLYRGHLFSRESEHSWMLAARERMRCEWLWLVKALGQHHESIGDWSGAAKLYQSALSVDPDVEELYRKLMLCQQETGSAAEAISTYQLCRRHLLQAIGAAPSAETERLFQVLRTQSECLFQQGDSLEG
ncbi:MAG: bacterial transcriptional activator domain-containing protein [Burkholderiales bacterium]|nr:bacterial transcriptional activator domain-containing protein [Burkholderiales bacterium]